MSRWGVILALMASRKLEIRLLGGLVVLIDGAAVSLSSRASKLLVCLLFAPVDRSRWAALGIVEPRRAKQALRVTLGDEWIDGAYGACRLRTRPWVDVEQLPSGDEEAFEFCCDHGEFLPEPEFGAPGWIEEARRAYHERLAAITARLIERDTDAARVDALLARAAGVLTAQEIQLLRDRYVPRPEAASVIDDRVAYLVRELESAAEHAETAQEAHVIATLYAAIDEIEARAIARRPCSSELLDRLSAAERLLRPLLRSEVEPQAWRLANSRMYASDTSGAFAELRPWVEGPHASASMLCIAGLLNMSAGWPTAAHAAFSAGLERCNAPVLSLMLREKRDILLPCKQGRPPSVSARFLREDPYFDEMSTGGRASIYCAEAKSSGSAIAALRIFQTARELDADSENPHHELSVARTARRVGRADLAQAHLNNFEEMLQTRTAISLRYAQIIVRAELIEAEQGTAEARSSPRFRARLQEADTLYDAVASGARRRSDLSQACSALLGRARIALAIGDTASAFRLARTVRLLAASRVEQHLGRASALEAKAHVGLTAAEQSSLPVEAREQAGVIVRGLPAPLWPRGVAQAL